MTYNTKKLFQDDAYLQTAEAEVVAITETGGIILDQTVFYATSGGQPGDSGSLTRADGTQIRIFTTITGTDKSEIVHQPEEGAPTVNVGEKLTLRIDWERRLKLMRMHTACHILSVVCPFPITGAAVGEDESRVDFAAPDALYTKELVTEKMMELVNGNHPIHIKWISDEELIANPGLVKSKNVRPPVGSGRIRLVEIGEEAALDSQPCGGTHVSMTGEIGALHIGKIENKGKENRRFRIRFGNVVSV
ncbi:alanyl-tRNA editing protein [Paenochrobactrum sp. BZR 588]|uniref:alanyl-tRNA editing protein n=1 Tax=unclassified Paenochrobactrum TaxID=2639760 RepID=UPI003851F64F